MPRPLPSTPPAVVTPPEIGADMIDTSASIESPAVRARLAELFITHSFRNGFLPLVQLVTLWRQDQHGVYWSTDRIRAMVTRSEHLVLAEDMVLWIGKPSGSVLIGRLRQIFAARMSPLALDLALRQAQRGEPRLAQLTVRHLAALGEAHPEMAVTGGAIHAADPDRFVLAIEVSDIERKMCDALRRTSFSMSIAEIARATRLKPAKFEALLATSPVICDAEPGRYRSIRQAARQLALFAS